MKYLTRCNHISNMQSPPAGGYNSNWWLSIRAHWGLPVNVMQDVMKYLETSEGTRSGQNSGSGGIYHLETGSVEFLGQSPLQKELLDSSMAIPPSMVTEEGRGLHGVRTGADERVPSDLALSMLKKGNERFAAGAPTAGKTSDAMRKALVKHNQAPHSAIVGCADSRVPVDTVFNATPGELFVLRNAGNTCTHAEGSIVGSLEFCTGKLGSKLILVLGHPVWCHCWGHCDPPSRSHQCAWLRFGGLVAGSCRGGEGCQWTAGPRCFPARAGGACCEGERPSIPWISCWSSASHCVSWSARESWTSRVASITSRLAEWSFWVNPHAKRSCCRRICRCHHPWPLVPSAHLKMESWRPSHLPHGNCGWCEKFFSHHHVINSSNCWSSAHFNIIWFTICDRWRSK